MRHYIVPICAALGMLTAASHASASESITLSDSQMDSISAGTSFWSYLDLSAHNSIGALSYSGTEATLTPYGNAALTTTVSINTGLLNNGSSFTIVTGTSR